ncbi:MAG: SH3 domain-containing protein [Desulfobacterales bacterium]|nr:SH3 domain-containing protein [Desulfobacterales bacterium]
MVLRKLLLFTLCFFILGTQAAWSTDTGSMSIQVKQSQVRTAPSFMARIITTLQYGDRVYVASRQGTWTQVFIAAAGTKGWVHSSALTRKKIVLKAGAADVNKTATSDELALAGKGFNKKVEGEFKAKNQNLDYARIDQMEKMKASQSDIQKFLKAGAVSPRGGVQ